MQTVTYKHITAPVNLFFKQKTKKKNKQIKQINNVKYYNI